MLVGNSQISEGWWPDIEADGLTPLAGDSDNFEIRSEAGGLSRCCADRARPEPVVNTMDSDNPENWREGGGISR